MILEPDSGLSRPRDVAVARKRMVAFLLALPLVVALTAGAGWLFGGAAARLHPTVELAERSPPICRRSRWKNCPTPERLALTRAEKQAKDLVPRALELRDRFRSRRILVRLVDRRRDRRKADQPRHGPASGRIPAQPHRLLRLRPLLLSSCPQERIRLGLAPTPEMIAAHPPA